MNAPKIEAVAAKSKPDGLNYATLGEGSYPELFLKWLNNQWNTQILGVPYRGGGPAAQALADGLAEEHGDADGIERGCDASRNPPSLHRQR